MAYQAIFVHNAGVLMSKSPSDPNYEYTTFLLETLFPWCWACGRGEADRPDHWYGPWILHRAHIGSGSGSMRREQDRRAVNLLCPLCHSAHGSPRRHQKLAVPELSNDVMIWLKKRYDPEFWDKKYVESLWLGKLPVGKLPGVWYNKEYASRRGARPKVRRRKL